MLEDSQYKLVSLGLSIGLNMQHAMLCQETIQSFHLQHFEKYLKSFCSLFLKRKLSAKNEKKGLI